MFSAPASSFHSYSFTNGNIDDIPYWNVAMAGALLVMMPPILVVLLMQRWFVRGLVEREK